MLEVRGIEYRGGRGMGGKVFHALGKRHRET